MNRIESSIFTFYNDHIFIINKIIIICGLWLIISLCVSNILAVVGYSHFSNEMDLKANSTDINDINVYNSFKFVNPIILLTIQTVGYLGALIAIGIIIILIYPLIRKSL